MKRVTVRLRGTGEKGTIVFAECMGIAQEDTIEGSLCRGPSGRSLESHGVVEPVGGMCHGNSYQKEVTRLHAVLSPKTG